MTSGAHQIQVRGSPGAIECGFVKTFQPFAVSCAHSPPNSLSDTSSADPRPRRGRDVLPEASASAGAARLRRGGGASSEFSSSASKNGAMASRAWSRNFSFLLPLASVAPASS